ncbi:PH domain-containing protein [Candidatus Uhrbacteria bacterium]|nr:PH domain-containing protein [Candidatus Uhrbacteria bacterium]
MPEITEKIYPIERTWLLYTPIGYVIALIVAVLLRAALHPIFLWITVMFAFGFLLSFVVWKTFRFTLDESEFLKLKQNLIFIKQERALPYGVIQQVSVHQNILDRLFRLSTVTVENVGSRGSTGLKRPRPGIGFQGNVIAIPGLKKQNAEALRAALLQKIKEHPVRETGAGL